MPNEIERRAIDGAGNLILSEEQRRNPDSMIPNDCPPEYRALIKSVLLTGNDALIRSAYEQKHGETVPVEPDAWMEEALRRSSKAAEEIAAYKN